MLALRESVHIRSYSGPYSPACELNTFSVRMLENTEQNNFEYGQFLRCVTVQFLFPNGNKFC